MEQNNRFLNGENMETIEISKQTLRRIILGRQGLWPGRRWSGKEGTVQALKAVEAVQMDPLNVVARSHDIVLWSRVAGYRPEYLQQALYQDRLFFDYGGGLFIYPMSELPYWRTIMENKGQEKRWKRFAEENQEVIREVRAALQENGPLGNRDFSGNKRVESYRGRKDTSLALYYLWLTGEVMIHHREGFERVYDLRDRVAPPEFNYAVTRDESEAYFARKLIAYLGLLKERRWKSVFTNYMERRMSAEEALARLQQLMESGAVSRVRIEGFREDWLVLSEDCPNLEQLEAGEVPAAWNPVGTTTQEEVVFLAPLDIVSARGRSSWIFDFEYVWEVYKPAASRRWGYYTLPVLFGDRLVARLDPKLDRSTGTLVIQGYWEEDSLANAVNDKAAYARAFARGLASLSTFVQAQRLDIAAVDNTQLKESVTAWLNAEADSPVEVVH
mgnify:CR=1 FL=1|jgi:uncharacterized protein YcaQ